MKLWRWVYRSADTGQFVTTVYAEMFPKTTVRERRWFWQRDHPAPQPVPGVYGPRQ